MDWYLIATNLTSLILLVISEYMGWKRDGANGIAQKYLRPS